MSEKISYSPLEADAKKIRELVYKEKYRDSASLIDTAIRILLAWESNNPGNMMPMIQGLMPFSPQQDEFMKTMWKPEQHEKHFGGQNERNEAVHEVETQEAYSPSSNDHIILKNNLDVSKKYVENLQIKKPTENIIYYDGYPLLFRFYSRFLPAKIVITVLGDMMRETNSSKIDLQTFRLRAYDVADEISKQLQKYEVNTNAKRYEKISTGLPKIEFDEKNIEKKARIQKRFKEQYVGKTRKDRLTNKRHFEGALIALDLIDVIEEEDNLYVSLTKKGKEFYLLDNPVINGDYSKSLSDEEKKFIYEKLLPDIKLEYEFVKTALKTVKDFKKQSNRKITDVLDTEFYNTVKIFNQNFPEIAEKFSLKARGPTMDNTWKKYILGYRVATMGRMAELSLIKWSIDENGESVFSIPDESKLLIKA